MPIYLFQINWFSLILCSQHLACLLLGIQSVLRLMPDIFLKKGETPQRFDSMGKCNLKKVKSRIDTLLLFANTQNIVGILGYYP